MQDVQRNQGMLSVQHVSGRTTVHSCARLCRGNHVISCNGMWISKYMHVYALRKILRVVRVVPVRCGREVAKKVWTACKNVEGVQLHHNTRTIHNDCNYYRYCRRTYVSFHGTLL